MVIQSAENRYPVGPRDQTHAGLLPIFDKVISVAERGQLLSALCFPAQPMIDPH